MNMLKGMFSGIGVIVMSVLMTMASLVFAKSKSAQAARDKAEAEKIKQKANMLKDSIKASNDANAKENLSKW